MMQTKKIILLYYQASTHSLAGQTPLPIRGERESGHFYLPSLL